MDNKMLKVIIIFAVLIKYNNAFGVNISTDTKINICGDGAGWPPYIYETGDKQIEGYDVDVLKKIFEKNNLNLNIKMLPWKRCLSETEKGVEFQIATSSSFSKERDEKYLLSESYYTLTPSYFYLKETFPKGLDIKSKNYLKKYNVCGLLGYNYANFGVEADKIDTGTKVFSQLVEKTSRKRCDLFIARQEIFVSFSFLGEDFVTKYNLGFERIPDAKQEEFYLLISRKHKDSKEIKKMIDEGIVDLRESGELAKMIDYNINRLSK